MIYNTHCHSKFSPDSQVEPQAYIDLAKIHGIGFVVTDHHDPDLGTYLNKSSYFDMLNQLSYNHLLIGVELGLNVAYLADMHDISKDNRFDLIIGSIHTINGQDAATTIRLSNQPRLDIERYYQHMLSTIQQFDGFDVLGHIDYPMRYTHEPIYVNDPMFRDTISHILSCIIERGQIIELNTKLLSQKSHYLALVDVYRLYKQLGGTLITVGSDAHHVSQFVLPTAKIEQFLKDTELSLIHIKDIKKRRLS